MILECENISSNNPKVRMSFSKAAPYYDEATAFHQEIGRRLIERLYGLGRCKSILDVGMGTGWFTARLRQRFPCAVIVGLDFASGMIEAAKKRCAGLYIIEADAGTLPFKDYAFDLITSNLAYQWAGDLSFAFRSSYDCLAAGGRFCFSMFGHGTFDELFICLSRASEREFYIQRLAGKRDVASAMFSAGFTNINIAREVNKIYFPDMMALLRWVKAIGANVLRKDVFVGRKMLSRASDYYSRHFSHAGGIYASLEVLWVSAVK